jgi:hypothetical protein
MSGMLGADVGGLERAGRKCLDAAQTADQVCQVMQALVMALRALETFTGPWAEALINFLTTVVIPWLKRIASALRLFGKVLNGHAGAQRRVSAGLPVDFGALPTYPRPELPPADPAGSPADPQWADVDPPDAETPVPDAPDAPVDGEPEPETFDTPPLAPATPAPPAAGSSGGGGWGGGGGSLPDLATADPTDAAGIAPPAQDPADEPEDAPTSAAPVTAVPAGRSGISGAQVAGLGATAAGAGLIGGASAYVAARRRAAQTDGSEVLGAASIDRPAPPRRGVATLADTQQASQAGSPAGVNAGTDPGAGTNGRRSS